MSIFRTQWTEKRIRLWQANRESGRTRWVLTQGVMGWGTTMFLVMTALSLFDGTADVHLRTRLIVGMIIWPIAGLVWGMLVWSWTERSYQKHVERRES